MERNKNPNHPRKGREIRVDPIRRSEDIQAIKQLLSGTPRDLLLFTMGINNGQQFPPSPKRDCTSRVRI